NTPLNFAVVGAHRGQSFIEGAQNLSGEVKLVAVCDIDPEALAPWQDKTDITCFDNYEQLLNDPTIDAVCIATPVPIHARQAIQALQAGKHVLSEVTAAYSIDECWELVEAVEKSGLTYMMAENYCYMRENMMLENMVQQGVFGEVTFASGAYLHDCRDLMWDKNGNLTWRGKVRTTHYGNTYPTHSLGPVSRWLGINKTDRFISTTTWGTPCRAIPSYAARNWPDRKEYQRDDLWVSNDNAVTLLKTAKGAVAEIRVDWASPRPHNMVRHELQGTKASFTTQEPCNQSLIWMDGRSETSSTGIAEAWETLEKYYQEFEHPLWKHHMEDAEKAGHGGGDYFVMREFASAVRENRPPYVDVYDAVTWSSITPLGMKSIDENNSTVEMPDFKSGRAK
ncbi:MAG: Gfo/Idh/MocA family oxidoreductase, partial [Abditibacteriaceae bacterium]